MPAVFTYVFWEFLDPQYKASCSIFWLNRVIILAKTCELVTHISCKTLHMWLYSTILRTFITLTAPTHWQVFDQVAQTRVVTPIYAVIMSWVAGRNFWPFVFLLDFGLHCKKGSWLLDCTAFHLLTIWQLTHFVIDPIMYGKMHSDSTPSLVSRVKSVTTAYMEWPPHVRQCWPAVVEKSALNTGIGDHKRLKDCFLGPLTLKTSQPGSEWVVFTPLPPVSPSPFTLERSLQVHIYR